MHALTLWNRRFKEKNGLHDVGSMQDIACARRAARGGEMRLSNAFESRVRKSVIGKRVWEIS